MYMRFALSLFVLTLLNSKLQAAEEFNVLVEDSVLNATDTPAAPSISVLTAKDIKKSGATTVSELIATVPGLFVAQNGGDGQPTSVFIRGAESRHTLVLVDGIELNDPLNPTRSFDFSSLTTENIERVEIFRGAQSVRFGSDAIGGVINIITTRGTGSLKTTAQIEAGSYSTLKTRIGAAGKNQNFDYSIGLSHFSSGGFSAADTGNSNAEADSSKRTTLSSHLGYQLNSDSNLQFSLRANQLDSDLDVNGGALGDDSNYTANSKQMQIGAQFNSVALNKTLLYSLGISSSYNGRSDDNPPDSLQPATDSTNYFVGQAYQFESRNEYIYSNQQSWLFGAKVKTESGHSESNYNGFQTDFTDHDNSSTGVYAIHQYKGESFASELGLRQDQRTNYGGITNAQAKLTFPLPAESLVQVEYGTGFKNPSLYQLYSSYGNLNLEDEKSATASLAFEKTWHKTFFFAATYFSNQYKDLIDFDTVTSKYYNLAEASSSGLELEVKWQLSSTFALKSSLTQLQTENKATGAKLARRPDTTATVELLYAYERWKASMQYNYVGARNDLDPTVFTPITMPSYDVVNAEVSYAAAGDLSYSGRVVNLLNREYQSVAGYTTSELAFYAGVSKDF